MLNVVVDGIHKKIEKDCGRRKAKVSYIASLAEQYEKTIVEIYGLNKSKEDYHSELYEAAYALITDLKDYRRTIGMFTPSVENPPKKPLETLGWLELSGDIKSYHPTKLGNQILDYLANIK